MKKTALAIIFFLLIGDFSFGQEVDNKVPMYGEIPKSEYHEKLDKEFIKDVVKKYGSKKEACEAHVDFGWRYYYNKDGVTSMKRFNQAWLLNPDNPDIYFGFAALTEAKGNQKEADRLYRIGLDKDVKKERAEICYKKIADCKEQNEDYNGTINAYLKIIELNDKNTFAYKKLGYFYSFTSDSIKSEMYLTRAIELDPKDELTYNNRGHLYHKEKAYQKAIDDYSKAIMINPKYISAYVNRGLSKTELGDIEGAKNDFQISSDLDPKSPELKKYLGFAKLTLKDIDGACADFKEALKLGDTHAEQWIKEINCT